MCGYQRWISETARYDNLSDPGGWVTGWPGVHTVQIHTVYVLDQWSAWPVPGVPVRTARPTRSPFLILALPGRTRRCPPAIKKPWRLLLSTLSAPGWPSGMPTSSDNNSGWHNSSSLVFSVITPRPTTRHARKYRTRTIRWRLALQQSARLRPSPHSKLRAWLKQKLTFYSSY